MTVLPSQRPLALLPRLTPITAGAVILLGVLVLLGWSSASEWLKRLGLTGPAMNPVTAVAFVFSGVALLLTGLPVHGVARATRYCRGALSAVVLLAGAGEIVDYAFDASLGIDRLLFTADLGSNQIAPNTALGLVLVGAAILLIDIEGPRGGRPAQTLALGAIVLAVLALIGYVYGLQSLYGVSEYIPMAINSAIAFVIVGGGILTAHPDRGLMRAFSSPGPGGILMRRLLPAALLIPALLGWLCVVTQRDGHFTREAAVGLFAVANMLVSAVGVVLTATLLDRADGRRRDAEHLLLAERHLLHALMDHLPDSIFFKDLSSRFTRINVALARRLGLSDPAQAIGKTDFDFFTAEHARPAFEDEQEVLRTGQPVGNKEEKESWADGRTRWVLTTRLPLFDPAGAVVGTYGIARDITERKRTEVTLRLAEEQQRLLLESTGEGIYGIDSAGNCTFINPAASEMLAYSADEARGKNMHELVHHHRPDGSPYPVDECPIFQSFRTGQSRRVENEVFWRKDGTSFPVDYATYPIRVEGKGIRGAVITFTDNTESEHMRALLVQSEKLASIGLLSAGIAHEINNPLAYVANNLAVLHRDFKGLVGILDAYESAHGTLAAADPAAAGRVTALAEELDLAYVRDNLDRVLTRTREGVQRVTNIVQGLRSLARTDRPQLEEAQFPELIEMALELIRERLRRRGIAIETDYGPGLKLRCVPTQVGQVMLNLLTNAMHAIEGGPHSSAGRIRIRARRTGSDVVIEVDDNGGGIDPNHLSQVFDPFFTTKPVGEGTGLGLAISHGIVTGHGGKIEVQSRLGEGTCFRVTFPVNPGRIQATALPGTSLPSG